MTAEDKYQKDVADITGVHQTRVSSWLLGQPIALGAALKLEATGPKIPASWWLEPVAPAPPKRKRVAKTPPAQSCAGEDH